MIVLLYRLVLNPTLKLASSLTEAHARGVLSCVIFLLCKHFKGGVHVQLFEITYMLFSFSFVDLPFIYVLIFMN